MLVRFYQRRITIPMQAYTSERIWPKGYNKFLVQIRTRLPDSSAIRCLTLWNTWSITTMAFIILGKWAWTLRSKLGLMQILTVWWSDGKPIPRLSHAKSRHDKNYQFHVFFYEIKCTRLVAHHFYWLSKYAGNFIQKIYRSKIHLE